MRQQHRIADMLIQADNNISHYGQPHMLPRHGGRFNLQGYSNPYDYPSTLGAGHCMEGGGMSGGINWKAIGNHLVSGLGKATQGLTKMGLSYAGMGRSGGARSGGNIFGKLGKVATGALQKVAPRLIEEGMKYAMGGARPHISHLTEHELPLLYHLKKNEIKALHGAGFFSDLGKIATGVLGQVVDKAGPKLIDAGLEYALGSGRSGGRRGRPRKHHMVHPHHMSHHMEGAGFWGDVGKGLKQVGNVFKPIVGVNPVEAFQGGYDWGEELGTKLAGGKKPRGRPRKHHAHHMKGAGFWGDLGKIATGVVGQVVDKAGPKLIDEGLKYALGSGRSGGRATLPASGRLRNTARGDIVRAIMEQRGVNLPTASRIVKQEGLY